MYLYGNRRWLCKDYSGISWSCWLIILGVAATPPRFRERSLASPPSGFSSACRFRRKNRITHTAGFGTNFGWIRSPLFLWGTVQQRRLIHRNRSLPCFTPFDGDFTNWTLTHSLHRLVPGRFLFLCYLVRASLLMFRFDRRRLLHGVDVYCERSGRRSPPNMPCGLRVTRFWASAFREELYL